MTTENDLWKVYKVGPINDVTGKKWQNNRARNTSYILTEIRGKLVFQMVSVSLTVRTVHTALLGWLLFNDLVFDLFVPCN